MEQYDDVGDISNIMVKFLSTYRGGDWSLMTVLYGHSTAYVINKDKIGPTAAENPNLCYVARLDKALLIFMVRVYQN
jgi:hypothetical protein